MYVHYISQWLNMFETECYILIVSFTVADRLFTFCMVIWVAATAQSIYKCDSEPKPAVNQPTFVLLY